MTSSVRRKLIEAMRSTFQAVDEATHGLKFSIVAVGPLADPDYRRRYSIGLVPQQEIYGDLYPHITRELQVAIEFRVTVNRDDEDPGLMAEHMLGVIETICLADITWGGRAIDTKLMGNEVNMATFADRTVDGVLFVRVKFRHARHDPTNPDPVD
jgi:hypothetical protein